MIKYLKSREHVRFVLCHTMTRKIDALRGKLTFDWIFCVSCEKYFRHKLPFCDCYVILLSMLTRNTLLLFQLLYLLSYKQANCTSKTD